MNDKDSKHTQKATKIEISFIFKSRILVLEFTAKIWYVVNFAIWYRAGGLMRHLARRGLSKQVAELNKVHFVSFKEMEMFLTIKKIIEFGFRMLWTIMQVWERCYPPKPKADLKADLQGTLFAYDCRMRFL